VAREVGEDLDAAYCILFTCIALSDKTYCYSRSVLNVVQSFFSIFLFKQIEHSVKQVKRASVYAGRQWDDSDDHELMFGKYIDNFNKDKTNFLNLRHEYFKSNFNAI